MKKIFSYKPSRFLTALAAGGGILLLFVAAGLSLKPARPGVSEQPLTSAQVQIDLTAADWEPLPDSSQAVYTSETRQADFPFYAMGSKFLAELPERSYLSVYVRAKDNESAPFSDWREIGLDEDAAEHNQYALADNTYVGALTPVTGQYYQVKVVRGSYTEATPRVDTLSLEYFGHEEPVRQSWIRSALAGTKIYTRAAWGADESLRVWNDSRKEPQTVPVDEEWYQKYAHEMIITRKVAKNDQGQNLTWPLSYARDINKITIHHTAKEIPETEYDALQYMRALYQYHTLSRGWGDVGYHYIIDPFGNVYEGRYGGDSVVGAHVGKHNIGNIGIALMGNYIDCSEKYPADTEEYQDCKLGDPDFTDYEITAAAEQALIDLLIDKTNEYDLDPTGYSSFRGKNVPNIIGHRDLAPTKCPGNNLQNQLNDIRRAVKQKYRGQSSSNTTVVDDSFAPPLSELDLKPTDLEEQASDKVASQPTAVDFKAQFTTGNPQNIVLRNGSSSQINLRLENTGNTNWTGDSYLKVTKLPDNFTIKENRSGSGILTENELTGPEEIATFPLTIAVDSALPGTYTLQFVPVLNGFYTAQSSWDIQVTVANNDNEAVGGNDTEVPPQNTAGSDASAATTVSQAGFSFADVPVGHPHYQAINQLQKQKVIHGFPDGSFKPDRAVTRAEALKIAINGANINAASVASETPIFPDVPLSHSLSQYVNYAQANGYVHGYNDGNFRPDSTITRGESAKVLLNINGISPAEPTVQAYADVPLSLDLAKYINFIKTRNLLETGGQDFGLNQPMTRGDLVEMMYRLAGNTEAKTIVASSEVATDQFIAEPTMRVELGFRDDKAVITGKEPFVLIAGDRQYHFSANQEVAVSVSGTTLKFGKEKLGDTIRFEQGDVFTITNWENRPGWNQDLNDNLFRHTLELRLDGEQLYAINELPLESYLAGLAEVSNSAPPEKQKAMAVIARSYAYYYLTQEEKYPGQPYTLNSDPDSSQKYRGYGYELRSPNFRQAVQATRGEMVTYQGTVVKTPYFSKSDGRTRSAEEVWGWTHTPYLQSVPDPLCTHGQLEGHGVGLSGCGAEAAAKLGKSYREILEYYYQDIALQALY